MTPSAISVAGVGVTRRAPDLMRVELSVESVRERAADAMAAVGALADHVVAVARSAGIAAEDIRSSAVSLAPDRVEAPDGLRVTGYRASESFQLTVRRLHHAGPTLEMVANACPSQVRVDAVGFGVADQDDLRRAAREAAYTDAWFRADHYARLSGRTLGDLRTLEEQPTVSGAPASYPIAVLAADLPRVEEQVTVRAVFATC